MKRGFTNDPNEPAANQKLAVVFAVALVLAGAAGCSSPGQGVNQEDSNIRLNVNLIELSASVVDETGKPVPGLGKGNFHLFVDGRPQSIAFFGVNDAPVAAGIVIDNSASMARKGPEVIAAALAFARVSNPLDQMFVVHFSGQVRFGLPDSQPFTGDISQLDAALSKFNAEGTTALYDAVALAISHCQTTHLQRKVLLVISDGGDNSSRIHFQELLSIAEKSGVMVYCLGIFDEGDPDRNPEVLTKLAEITGGNAVFPTQLRQATNTCVTIARDIRQQYSFAFEGVEDGQYHRIELAVDDPDGRKLFVRTRAGYFAPEH